MSARPAASTQSIPSPPQNSSAAPSLRLRLLLGTLSAVAVIWIASAVAAWQEAQREAEAVFDAHLAQTATLLLAFADDEPDELAEHLPPLRYARPIAYQVRDGRGRLVARGGDAPADALAPATEGFADSRVAGRDWRVFTLGAPEHGYLVQVGEPRAARDEVAHELASHLLWPLAIALPLLGIALTLLIGRGLRPLQALAQAIADRRPEDLSALPEQGQPREVRPLVKRLNALFGRVARALEQERRFTADAAHELRTPLAAIRAHAQVALAEPDAARRQVALARVVEATDRATRLTAQLLTLARLDAEAFAEAQPCALRTLAVEVLADLAPDALARGVAVELAGDEAAHVPGQPELLRVLLRNLVDNAVRHAPSGSTVEVHILPAAKAGGTAGPGWRVTDQGPGIPPAERAAVLRRFHRLAGAPQGGTGLGLSIVARICELHGAQFILDDGPDGHGLSATVRFGAPAVTTTPAASVGSNGGMAV